MTKKAPPANRKWSGDAQRLWRAINAEFVLDVHHSTLLRQACELLTRADQARREIAKSGLTIVDRYGGTKVSPLVEVERSSINSARLVLRELGLDFEGRSGPEESVRLHRAKGYA